MNFFVNEEIDRNVWNAHVQNKAYFRFEWFEVIKTTYRLEPFYVLLRENDDFALIGSFKTNKGYISLPYLSHSGYLYNSEILFNTLLKYLREKNITINNRNMIALQPNPLYVNSVARIDNIEDYQKNLSGNTRNQIKKSQKFGFTVECEKGTDNFYRIYSLNMHRLGTPVHKKGFISAIMSSFPESSIITVFDGKKAIGSMLFLFDNDTLYDVMASTLNEYNKKYANYFLYWEAIKLLKEKGLFFLDMGRSSFDSGTYHFKQKFRPVNYSIASGSNYSKSGSYSMASIIWKMLPYHLTLLLGPFVRKYLP